MFGMFGDDVDKRQCFLGILGLNITFEAKKNSKNFESEIPLIKDNNGVKIIPFGLTESTRSDLNSLCGFKSVINFGSQQSSSA